MQLCTIWGIQETLIQQSVAVGVRAYVTDFAEEHTVAEKLCVHDASQGALKQFGEKRRREKKSMQMAEGGECMGACL